MLRVQNMLARPESLLTPSMVGRVLATARRSPASRGEAPGDVNERFRSDQLVEPGQVLGRVAAEQVVAMVEELHEGCSASGHCADAMEGLDRSGSRGCPGRFQ